MIRTGYSFKKAYGHLEDVLERLKAAGYPAAPIADFNSTFGFVRWDKLCRKAGIKPVFGVELAVSASPGDKKPIVDHWTFIAKDSLRPLHDLIALATEGNTKEPLLSYRQAQNAEGLFKIAGHAARLDEMTPADDLFIGLSPAINKGMFNRAAEAGFSFIARSDNLYPMKEDKEAYRIALGRRANTQTYPQWILSDGEWDDALSWTPEDERAVAFENFRRVLNASSAKLVKSGLPKTSKDKTLRLLCEEGAARLGANLADPVYAERLDREIRMLEEKGFTDYIFIIADMVTWAKERMIVGPARGSSCGSLVCYLTGITSVDPIPYGLIFERFVDVNRNDLPDIDIDFSDDRRDLVFDYAEKKYGSAFVGRLGTVGVFRSRSALNQIGTGLNIPKWLIENTADNAIVRADGDDRVYDTLEDTFQETSYGRKLIAEYPEAKIATKIEGHPNTDSQHAAGIVISDKPLTEYVAINSANRSIMCDKKDAEALNLLKIDALGLTQLSIFERCLELIGKPSISGVLEKLPLDDPAAFDVLNNGYYSGIFQFDGNALKSLTKQIRVTGLEDLVALTSLARPGPMASGGAAEWIKRKNGGEISYYHPCFEPILKDTLGIIVYQEQVMRIGREIGDMTWAEVTDLRRAIGKKLGAAQMATFKDKWAIGALAKGVQPSIIDHVWNDVCTFGAYGFNRCLDGRTKIRIAHANGCMPKFVSISELYRRYESHPKRGVRQRKLKPRLVSLYSDKRGKPQKAVRIIKNGKMPCFKYLFSDGSSVVCTNNHKFLINGKWSPIGASKPGDFFASLETNKQSWNSMDANGKGHAKGKKWKIKNGSRKGENNVGWKNGISKFKKDFRKKMTGRPCEDCGRVFTRMEIHHNDFNQGVDRPKDLAWLCTSDHKKRHYSAQRTRQWQKGMRLVAKKLVSSSYVGMRQTYDIEMPRVHNFTLANGLVTHNSHSVAYSIVSYWCCWLKAHHPVEFAAATLDAKKEPAKQLQILRELKAEGVDYIPVDPDHSGARWEIKVENDRKILVGPLTQIKGIGPVAVKEIIDSRKTGKELSKSRRALLEGAKTEIDDLYPIEAAVRKLHPDLAAVNIVTTPTPISSVQCGQTKGPVVIIGVVKRANQKNENGEDAVRQRGRRVEGPEIALNMFVADDHDEIFVKVDRYKFEEMGRPILDKVRAGKSLYAFKGTCPTGFRMVSVQAAKYLGEIEDADRLEE